MSLKLELRNLKFQQNAGIQYFLKEKPNIRYPINKTKNLLLIPEFLLNYYSYLNYCLYF